MMEKTLNLVKQLVEQSENFLAHQLDGWGFEVLPASHGIPEDQSQGKDGSPTRTSTFDPLVLWIGAETSR
jgi:hypothetical protein